METPGRVVSSSGGSASLPLCHSLFLQGYFLPCLSSSKPKLLSPLSSSAGQRLHHAEGTCYWCPLSTSSFSYLIIFLPIHKNVMYWKLGVMFPGSFFIPHSNGHSCHRQTHRKAPASVLIPSGPSSEEDKGQGPVKG